MRRRCSAAILLSIVVLCGNSHAAEFDGVFRTLEYTSSVDETGPLKFDIAYRADGRKKPLIVVMHGYSGDRNNVTQDIQELADRGAVAIAPDMRGRGGSAGHWDSSGFDVHDILDAVLAAIEVCPEVDPCNLNIVGYSGGGGNAIACMARFPDLFRNYVSFFGISDYGWWHASKGRPDCNVRMEKALGGSPDEKPELYIARNFVPAAGNVVGNIHFFWDSEETACPPEMIENFIDGYRSVGGKQESVHVSKPGDEKRWIHGHRSHNRDISDADDLFLPDILVENPSSPQLPEKGRLVVCGYLVTRSFQVWVEDGQRGRVVVDYDLSGESPKVEVVDNPRNEKVRIDFGTPLANLPACRKPDNRLN